MRTSPGRVWIPFAGRFPGRVPARFVRLATVVAALAAGAATTWAAVEVPRRSPRGLARLDTGGAVVTIDYGRPGLAGRAMFGSLVPWGEPWRTGDDQAPMLTAPVPIRLGTLDLEPGRYSLFLVPQPPGAPQPPVLIVNRRAEQWGIYNRDPRWDVGQIEIEARPIPRPVERFTVVWEPTDSSHGRLWWGWDTTLFVLPFELRAGGE